MLKTKTIIIASLTGLCLFVYAIFLNSQESSLAKIVEILKPIILVGVSIVIVDIISFLVVDILLTYRGNKKASNLLRLVVAILLYVPCAFIIFRLLGRDITALAATSTLLGAVIGFALQTPLGNFLSGIFLRVAQPFNIGDYIHLEASTIKGLVIDFDWRTTDIRLDSGEILLVPNATVANTPIRVMRGSEPSYECVDFKAPATAPPNQVIKVALAAVQNEPNANINYDQSLFVRMSNYNLGEIEYKLYYLPKRHQLVEVNTNPQLRCRLWYALGRAGFGCDYNKIEKNEKIEKDEIRLISNIEFFRFLSYDAHKLIRENSQTFLFDIDESNLFQSLPSRSMVLVLRGAVSIDQEVISEGGSLEARVFTRRTKGLPPLPLPQSKIEQISTQLAKFLGPVAFCIVKDLAKEEFSVFRLYQTLAAEIPDLKHRQEFLRYQPLSPTELFQRGDIFGEMTLFLGEPLPDVGMRTIEETEVLAITPSAILAALSADECSLAMLSQQVAEYYEANLKGTLQALSFSSVDSELIETLIQQRFHG